MDKYQIEYGRKINISHYSLRSKLLVFWFSKYIDFAMRPDIIYLDA